MTFTLPDRDLSLAEAYAFAEAAGIAQEIVPLTIAEACSSGQIISTGFGHHHNGERHEAAGERKRIPHQHWLILAAVDPSNAKFTQAQKDAFDAFACLTRNSITVRSISTGAESTWDQIAIDRTSIAQFMSRVRALNARRRRDGESEVNAWVAGYDGRSNVTIAWKAYREQKGARAAKKATFEHCWRIATGGRRPGRPPAG